MDKQAVLSDKTFLNLFHRLASSQINERHDSANELIHILTFKTSPLNASIDNQDASNDLASSQMQYSIDRLHKGLAGAKPEAKLGFSLALTMLYEKLQKRQIRAAFDVAEKCLLDMNTDSKQENSSKKTGLCFLLITLSRSGSFVKLRTSQKSVLLDQVVPLLDDKALVDLAAMALSSAVDQFSAEEFNSCLFEKLSPRLSCGWKGLDANTLLLLLCCHRHHREVLGRSFLKTHYATKRLISEEHFGHYLRVCLASNENRETMSSARLHPGVSQLLDCLLAKSSDLLAKFVAQAAATAAANAEAPAARKATAFNLIGWVADCPLEKLPDKADCLSECLADAGVCLQLRLHAASRSSVLHAFAGDLLGARILNSPPEVLIAVARRLLGADCLFDTGLPAECRLLLKGDRLAKLPLDLLDDCARRIEATLEAASVGDEVGKEADSDAASDASASDKATAAAAAGGGGGAEFSKRVATAMQTLRQLASSRVVLVGRPKSSARMLLCLAGRFLAGSSAASSAAAAKAAFCRALDSMSAFSGQPAYHRCLQLLSKGLANRLQAKEATKSSESTPSSARQCLTRGLELLSTDSGSSGDSGSLDWCFALAYLHLGFHLLTNAEDTADADARALLVDLDECHRRSSSSSSSSDGAEGGGGAPMWSDVLLDSFLGLLAASRSHLLRSVAGLVAKQIAPLVTLEGVAALTQALVLDEEEEDDGRRVGDDEDSGDEEGDEIMDDGAGEENGSVGDEESEISIPEQSSSSEEDETAAATPVDPEFRRRCKQALGEAACPSDVEDADPSDLSDSAMERVDEALSLAFRMGLHGPQARRQLSGGDAASRAAALERRRRQCQARLRALDLAEALLAGGVSAPQCRRALAAGLARLALLAAGGATPAVAAAVDGDDASSAAQKGKSKVKVRKSFWTVAPAAEREQLRQRAVVLLRRCGVFSGSDSASPASTATSVDDEICRTVESALAANLRSPLPVKLAQTAAEIVSTLARLHPTAVERRLSDALSVQLAAGSSKSASQHQRLRIGGLALWQRVSSERPRLLRRLRGRLLEMLVQPPSDEKQQLLRPFDRAAVASLTACLVHGDSEQQQQKEIDAESELANSEYYRRLAEWTFDRLAAEAAGVTSAVLLSALLNLATALLRLRQKELASGSTLILSPKQPEELAGRLKSHLAGCHNRDLRRSLHTCLSALSSVGRNQNGQQLLPLDEARAAKRKANQEKRKEKKLRKLLNRSEDGKEVEKMEVE